MTLSRRSFLKVAGLTVVAAAGASMFTGCSSNVLTTPVEYVAADESDKTVTDAVEKLNKDKKATSVLGGSDLHNKNYESEKKSFNTLIEGLGYKDVEVKDVVVDKKLKNDGSFDHYYLKVTLINKTTKK